VDATDDGLAQALHIQEEIDEEAALAVARDLRGVRGESGEVRARAEGLVAGAGEEHGAHLVVALCRRECRQQVAQHLRTDSVALFRPVEGNGRDGIADVIKDVGQLQHSRPLVWRRQAATPMSLPSIQPTHPLLQTTRANAPRTSAIWMGSPGARLATTGPAGSR